MFHENVQMPLRPFHSMRARGTDHKVFRANLFQNPTGCDPGQKIYDDISSSRKGKKLAVNCF
jgi:hypothetical protein